MNRPPLLRRLYARTAPALAALLPLAAPLSGKLRAGIAGRRHLLERLLARGAELRGCLWFHAASVGEYEQLRPVLAELRRRGHGPLVVTHFSPSGAGYARDHREGDLHDYLPWDRPADMAALVAGWRPRLLVYGKYDCWPNLVAAAAAAGVPQALVAASLPPRSWRCRRPWDSLFRSVYDDLDLVAAAWPRDADQFRRLGVATPVAVTGDPRAERVLQRLAAIGDDPVVAAVARWRAPLLILGSTWPPDERIWWPLLPGLLADHPELGIVLAPHEPTPDRLDGITGRLRRLGIPAATLQALLDGQPAASAARCLVIDRVGVLAPLYTTGSVAYVGGGFTTGVHSTLEPAGAGLPVLCGPRIGNAADAEALVAAGGAVVVRDTAEAAKTVRRWLADTAARRQAAAAARDVVAAQHGAAARTADLLERLLAEGSGGPAQRSR